MVPLFPKTQGENEVAGIAEKVKEEIQEFSEYVPLIVALRNDGRTL